MFRGVQDNENKAFWLAVGIFLSRIIAKERPTPTLMTESIEWADKFMSKYNAID